MTTSQSSPDRLANWRNDKVARSGNRPRFKPPAKTIAPLITLISLAAAISILQQAATPVLSCDKTTTTTTIGDKLAAQMNHQNSPPSSQKHVDNYRRPRRARRAADQPASEADALRVAAYASKLEHWLQCNRLALAAAQQPAGATQPDINNNANQPQAATTTQLNGCPAHFDGHLCWPPSKAGARVQLACPRLNRLPRDSRRPAGADEPSARQQSVKHVIDSIQQQQQINNSPPPDVVTGGQLSSIRLQQASGARTMAGDGQQTGQSFAWRTCQESGQRDESNGRRSIDASPVGAADAATGGQGESATLLAANLTGRWQDEADYSRCAPAGDGGGGQFDPTDQWIKLEDNFDRQLFLELTRALERIEANIDLYSDLDIQEQWSFCIGETMRQLRAGQQQPPLEANETGQHCPVIFDGWRCWPKTRAGETAYVSCPSNQPGFSAERKAHKICTNQADWYRHPLTNRYWSNYTTCVDTVDLAFRTKILNLYIIGNLISLIALTASLIIFISFKSLNCTRVTIHKNLFLSFITNNLMWIIWYTYVVNDADLLQSNPIECQFWHILLHYFLVSNYFWMFCEGLYLHTLLVVAFVSEDKILKWFYLLGWLTPVPITIAYAYNRSYDEYYTNFCWMEESPHNIILMAPIGISLLLNLIFLINIVRVLVTKLRANNSPDTHQTRKAVRATLILIPLLGLHYMLTPFRPEAKSEWEVIYEIVAAVCTSFQGLCVALLFCFCNGEVISVIKKKLKDTFRAREPTRSRSGTKSGSTCISLASKFSGSTNSSNNHHHHNHLHQHQLEASHTLRSIVSTSSQSDLVQVINTKVSVHAPSGEAQSICSSNNNNNSQAAGNMNNGNSGHAGPHRNSNSNSILTTITASPISVHNHSYRQLQSIGAEQPAAPYCETILQDGAGMPASEEAVKLL